MAAEIKAKRALVESSMVKTGPVGFLGLKPWSGPNAHRARQSFKNITSRPAL